jgi:16S rRNA (guanine966-N2)-methyltransferase
MFSMLTSMDVLEGASVLDLFSGSGALAIEALSRGAASAVLVERDPRAVETARSNLDVLGPWAGTAVVVRADVFSYLATAPDVDLVLADPPYGFDGWPALLRLLSAHAPLVVAETDGPFEPGPGWETVKRKKYGGTVVSVVQRVSPPAEASRPDASQEGEI